MKFDSVETAEGFAEPLDVKYGVFIAYDADGILTTSTYDAANELFTATTNSDITTFTHDANGNRILENANGSLTTYTWDEENRMVSADDGTNTDSFIYAGNGQRRKKSTSTQDINYLWDEQNILEELDDSNNLIAHYTGFPGYWGGLSSLAQPGSTPAPATAGMGTFNAVQFNQALFNQSSEQVETESHYYLFDLQASNRLLLNTNAATDNEYIYQSFGEKVLSSETIRNPFQFQGQVGPYFDAEKRTQMGARIVDPTMGKWFSPDPIRFAGGDWNLYRFVGNNPANLIDPSGLSCSCCNFFFAFAWCCDESCFTSPPIFLPKRNAYQGFGPWNNAIPDSGGGASQQWPLCSRSFAGGDHGNNYPKGPAFPMLKSGVGFESRTLMKNRQIYYGSNWVSEQKELWRNENPLEIYNNHVAGYIYDYKEVFDITAAREYTFIWVNGRWLRPAEFGNYAAGYVSYFKSSFVGVGVAHAWGTIFEKKSQLWDGQARADGFQYRPWWDFRDGPLDSALITEGARDAGVYLGITTKTPKMNR